MLRKILVTLLVLSLALIPMTFVGAETAQSYTIGFAVSTLENPFFVTMKGRCPSQSDRAWC